MNKPNRDQVPGCSNQENEISNKTWFTDTFWALMLMLFLFIVFTAVHAFVETMFIC